MTTGTKRQLPAMTALEFAIQNGYRNFFFGLRLVILWAIVLTPLTLLAWYAGAFAIPADVASIKPAALASSVALVLAGFVSGLSISVNWHRRIVLGETPSRFGWVRLDGVVWRYGGGLIVVVLAVSAILAVAAAAAIRLPSVLDTSFGGLFDLLSVKADLKLGGLGYIVAAFLGFSALFTFYRLASRLPAIAVGDRDYGLRKAWAATRGNRIPYLLFTFWLLFALAIPAGIGFGVVKGAEASGQAWAQSGAVAVSAVLGLLSRLVIRTVVASHYCYFAGRDVFPVEEAPSA